jgi:hypothetical protein
MILKKMRQQTTILSLPLSRFFLPKLAITAAAMPRTNTEYCR